MKWLAMFSQTGSEIVSITQQTGKSPDMIITNNKHQDSWHPELKSLGASIMISPHRDICEYLLEIAPAFITLHGYMRILPSDVVSYHEIINGHPGDIVTYPQLKGKDPQAKAIELELESTGVVLHKVIAEVDAGEILSHCIFNIPAQQPGYTANVLIEDLKALQASMWVDLLKERFKI